MTETERYSALMSVYEKEKPEYLKASIQSMLDQTVPPADFVIVCDGPLSPELTEVLEVFRAERPQLFQIVPLEKNGGLGPALNEGMKYCKYSLIARMDSDDISMPKRCERQLACMEDGDYALVGA